MARVAYVMLAHERPEIVARHAELITAADPTAAVYIHYDRNRTKAEYDALTAALGQVAGAILVQERVVCGWGDFGLVQATLNGLEAIAARGDVPDYVYLISGSCLPIRPLAELNRFLDENSGTEFIQIRDQTWIKGGLGRERSAFYFPFNFRTQRWLFDLSVKLQRALRIRRTAPRGLDVRFGSQWWCLTWATCRLMLDFLAARPDVFAFFRSTWIPDESFFQTLVEHVAPAARVAEPLTLFRFTDRGRPIAFYDDHALWLCNQKFFFARKIDPDASALKLALGEIAGQPDSQRALQDIAHVTPFYEAAVWARARAEPPGQVYQPDQRRSSDPGALSRNRRPYMMLFGPRPATAIAAATLADQGSTSVFGRVFHPARVGLSDYGETAPGLSSRDTALRDLNPALHLTRVIGRSPLMPVFEQTMLDTPEAAYLAQADDNCLFVVCLPYPHMLAPVQNWDSDYWRALTLLLLLDDEGSSGFRFTLAGPVSIRDALASDELWEYAYGNFASELGETFSWFADTVLAEPTMPNLLVLPWGGGQHALEIAMGRLSSARSAWRHGRELHPAALAAAATALSKSSMTDPALGLPPQIRDQVVTASLKIGIVEDPWPKARLERLSASL